QLYEFVGGYRRRAGHRAKHLVDAGLLQPLRQLADLGLVGFGQRLAVVALDHDCRGGVRGSALSEGVLGELLGLDRLVATRQESSLVALLDIAELRGEHDDGNRRQDPSGNNGPRLVDNEASQPFEHDILLDATVCRAVARLPAARLTKGWS